MIFNKTLLSEAASVSAFNYSRWGDGQLNMTNDSYCGYLEAELWYVMQCSYTWNTFLCKRSIANDENALKSI